MKRFSEDELNKIDSDFYITSTDDEWPYTSAYHLKMGLCDYFALALHDIFGYECCEVPTGRSHHCFCRTSFNNKVIYIDACGMFENLTDVLSGQNYGEQNILKQDISVSRKEVAMNQHYEVDGYAFAVKFINSHKAYYDVHNYE